MFKTIDSQLKVFFNIPFTVILLCGILYFASDYIFLKILDIENNLELLKLKEKQKAKLESDFLTFESTNSIFFETKKSTYINQLHRNSKIIDSLISRLNSKSIFIQIDKYQPHLDSIILFEKESTDIFQKLQTTIYEIGYKDYGLISKMRSNIHFLEAHITDDKQMISLLTIRRHEKDYFLRLDPKYIDLFLKEISILQQYINKEENTSTSQKQLLSEKLNTYTVFFLEITKKKNSVRQSNQALTAYNQHSEILITNIIKEVYHWEALLKKVLRIIYGIAISFVIILTFFIKGIIHNRIGQPLNKLATSIDRIVENNFTQNHPFNDENRKDEIGSLSRSMNTLLTAINEWKEKLENQTNSLIDQKELVNRKNLELNSYIEELNTTKNKIIEQHDILEKKNKSINESLNYASRIQHSLLPSTNILKSILPDHFIYYAPKDIVSGDFYWYLQLEDKLYITVADCTGHGVPGAFMSLLGISRLKDIIMSQPFLKSSEILNFLRQSIKEALSQGNENQHMREGMDMSFCIIDFETKNLQYAGAYNPIYIVRDQELISFKPDKMPIGHHLKEHPYFTDHEFKLEDEDHIYLFSDGYLDQIGGEKHKKFMKRKFQQLLCDISLHPMEKQKQIIDQTIKDWMGDNKQVDDMCILGLNFKNNLHHVKDISHFDFSHKNILIVEDNFAQFLLIKKAIIDAGGSIVHGQTGNEAVKFAHEQQFDLIIMDIFIPELDGFGAIEAIRKFNPEIPIIVQTSAVFGNEKEKATQLKCIDFLKKPFKKSDILAAIDTALHSYPNNIS